MSPATDCAPKHTLYPTVASTRAVSPPTPAERHRKHVTVASVNQSLSAVASCSVEVAVSPWCFCAAQVTLYSLVVAGVCSAEAAVRRARGHRG